MFRRELAGHRHKPASKFRQIFLLAGRQPVYFELTTVTTAPILGGFRAKGKKPYRSGVPRLATGTGPPGWTPKRGIWSATAQLCPKSKGFGGPVGLRPP